MKIPAVALNFLCLALLLQLALHGQSQNAEKPRFQVEILPSSASTNGKPAFVLRNQTGMVLVACHIQFSVSTQAQTAIDWDPVAGIHNAIPDPQGPFEPGAAMEMYLPHVSPGPLPDKVEVVAGIWADGETFGEADWVKELVDRRASLASTYEQAISLLQQGLDQNWTRDQYLAAVNNLLAPSGGRPSPYDLIRTAVALSPNSHVDPEALQHAIQDLSAHFTQKLDQLRPAKP